MSQNLVLISLRMPNSLDYRPVNISTCNRSWSNKHATVGRHRGYSTESSQIYVIS